MSSTGLVVGKALAGIYDFQVNPRSTNSTSTLLKIKKSILKITSIPILAIKMFFLQKLRLPKFIVKLRAS